MSNPPANSSSLPGPARSTSVSPSTQELDIKWDTKTTIGGTYPLVIVGPNGGGKTRLGAKLESQNRQKTTRISANRRIDPPSNLSHRSAQENIDQLHQIRTNAIREHWQLSEAINLVLPLIVSEHANQCVEFVAQLEKGEKPQTTPDTKASRVMKAWVRIFPGRELILGPEPKVKASHSGDGAGYQAKMLSDGEKSALLLAAEVFYAPPGLILVDEPDLHMHGALTRRFWDELEEARSDCRFIYITHDLGFARSRRNARFVIARTPDTAQLLDEGCDIPGDVFELVVGGLTLSSTARTLIFCESNQSGDIQLYQSWFSDPDIALMPAGTAQQVIESVRVLREKDLLKGGKVFGLIDADERDGKELGKLETSGVHSLKVSEIESLYCVEGVFKAVATYLNGSGQNPDQQFQKFKKNVCDDLNNNQVLLNKIALERFKRCARRKLAALLDKVKPDANQNSIISAIDNVLSSVSTHVDHSEFVAHLKAVQDSLAMEGSDWEKLLRMVLGKEIFKHAPQVLGVNPIRYRKIVHAGLRGELTPTLQTALRTAFASLLPSAGLGKNASSVFTPVFTATNHDSGGRSHPSPELAR